MERPLAFVDELVSAVVRRTAWLRFPLSEWLLRYPVLMLATAVVLLPALGVGGDLGLPALYFGGSALESALAGGSITIALGQIGFVGYLLDSKEEWLRARRPGPSAVRYYMTRSFLVAFALLCGGAAWFGAVSFIVGAALGGTVIGALLVVAGGPATAAGTAWLRRVLRGAEADEATSRASLIDDDPRWLHALQAAFAGLFCALLVGAQGIALLFDGDGVVVTPVAVAALLLSMIVAAYGFFRFRLPTHYGVVMWLALALLIALRPTCAGNVYDERLASDGATAPLVRYEATSTTGGVDLIAGGPLVRQSCDSRPLVVVALSGGGIRAATWGAAVLEHLHAELGDGFVAATRVISGASGGMVGAAAWVARLASGDDAARRAVTPRIAKDALGPVMRALLLPFGGDRGTALEDAWIRNTDGLMATTLAELRPLESVGRVPSLIFVPMVVEDGRRAIVSNLDLAPLTRVATPSAELSVSALELRRLFPDAVFRLSTAARMSASFPYVSPAAELPTTPRVRLVDAGYFDNYGIDILASWLVTHAADLEACSHGVRVVQIRDDLADRVHVGAPDDGWLRGLESLTSPPEAVLTARESSQSFRNDELLELLATRLAGTSTITVHTFSLGSSAPLSWRLMPDEVERIVRDLCSANNQAELAALARAFGKAESLDAAQGDCVARVLERNGLWAGDGD